MVRGARTNNLQDINATIPHGRLTVVTGVSGSGKSSLAFDTLYAEGQRLYVESMSAYARQFLERMRRPPVDHISGMLPSIALEQRNQVTNPRSTVGTATEINDFLRLLFANVGRTVCPDCRVEAERHSPQTAVRFIEGLPEGTRFLVLAPIAIESPQRLAFLRDHLASAGFRRALVGGEVVDIAGSEIGNRQSAIGNCLEVVVDRLTASAERLSRAADSLEMAFRIGSRGAVVLTLDADGRPGERHHFFAGLVCRSCAREFREPRPEMFSFNSGVGACPTCEGFGKEGTLDLDKIIPDHTKTLAGYAVALWATPVLKMMTEWMVECAAEDGIPTDVPYRDLTAEQRRWVIEGKPGGGDDHFCGIKGFFRWLEGKKYKIQNRILIARYRRYATCQTCGGTRLKPDAQFVKLGDRSFTELLKLPVPELHRFFDALVLPAADAEAARTLLREVRGRLQYLEDVGLSYLTLSRETRSLSGGEAQRIGLASALGSALTNTLYVLDEPTVGLHAADTQRLLAILRALTGKGNTVVCVEHEPEVILGADRVLDLGPGAGEHGGRLVFDGTPRELLDRGKGETADCLRQMVAQASCLCSPQAGRLCHRGRKPTRFITIRGARQHNLKNLTVRIPLGVLACVTGVSGAGKSTLVNSTLYAHWRARNGVCGTAALGCGEKATGPRTQPRAAVPHDLQPGKCKSLRGLDQVGDVVLVDQKPIGRSARSNAATYTKAYDDIRRAFAATRRARTLGITAAHFSFNVPGGRCESCQGMGTQTVDMQFLADVTVTCDACGGQRFQKRVLDVTDRDRSILDVLDMTIAEATEFYEDTPPLVAKLRPLAEVGLGYLRLGQSTATLSGGELQRLKLAAYIGRQSAVGSRQSEPGIPHSALRTPHSQVPHRVFIFNEPTVGLHMADVQTLMSVLQRLVDDGHSVLIVEHNLDVISQADWVIDLGPGGGDAGGALVAEGPPHAIAACERSVTGRFLRDRLGKGGGSQRA